MKSQIQFKSHQQGAALIVALIILAAITVVGVASMQSVTLEMKMVTSTLDRNKAFAAAESALSEIEDLLETTFTSESTLYSDACSLDDDAAATCFNPDCDDGFCFKGEYTSGMTKYECRSYVPGMGETIRPRPWKQATTWSDSGLHGVIPVPIPSSPNAQVKYIVEFLCFVRDVKDIPFSSGESGDVTDGFSDGLNANVIANNGKAYFQITVYLDLAGNNAGIGLAPVMLQSNFVYQI